MIEGVVSKDGGQMFTVSEVRTVIRSVEMSLHHPNLIFCLFSELASSRIFFVERRGRVVGVPDV